MELVPHEAAVSEFHKGASGFTSITSENDGALIVGWAFQAYDVDKILEKAWFWMTADGKSVTQDKSESYDQAATRCNAFIAYLEQSRNLSLELFEGDA